MLRRSITSLVGLGKSLSATNLEQIANGRKGDIRLGYCIEWDMKTAIGRIKDAETDRTYQAYGLDVFMPDDCRLPDMAAKSISKYPPQLKYHKERFLNVGEPVEFEVTRHAVTERAYRITGCGGSPVFGDAFDPAMFENTESKEE